MMPWAAAARPRPLLPLVYTHSLGLLVVASLLVGSQAQYPLPLNQISTSPPLAFLQDGYNTSIYENSLPRTYVVGEKLMGVPLAALPTGASIRYFIVGGDSHNFFTTETEEVGGVAVLHIRTRTGLQDVLNRERKARYSLQINGEVRGGHQKPPTSVSTTISTYVNVEVKDTNDNIPLFYPYSYKVDVGEDASLHASIVTVTADDADYSINGQVLYFLENPRINEFAVHPTTGVVSVTRTLDYSVKRKHVVTIVAQDRGFKPDHLSPASLTKATVEVSVSQVNIHDPRIIVRHLPHIVEHAHTHIYAIITVTDRDEGKSGEIKSVEIVSGDPEKLFTITRGSQPNEYNLAVLKLLDRELAPAGYNLTIKSSDSGVPSRSQSVNVKVNIADINDHSPVFVKEQYEEDISEEAPPDTPVVRVAASDTDQGINGKVMFRILAGNEDKKFYINPRTGLLSTAAWLDAESTAYYSLTVAAVDQASNARRKQSSAKVTVRVVDANDNGPQFNTPNTEVTLDENEPIGSYVTKIVATDLDSGENAFISYSIANLDQVPFTIDRFDGTIRTSSVLDFETQRRVYTIKVRAYDWGQPYKRETETTVTVKIRDINDNRPLFLRSQCSAWLAIDSEPGSNIMTFSAVDMDDKSIVSYRLLGEYDDCWALDSVSGTLSLTCDLRLRSRNGMKQRYILNITATDGIHTSDRATLILDVVERHKVGKAGRKIDCQKTNVLAKQVEVEASARENNAASETYALLPPRYGYNNHAPDLPPRFPEIIEIREDAAVDTLILSVAATDHDHGHNGRVVYAIAGGDEDSVFKIDVETGILKLWAPLDRERTSEYVLNITVYDLGIPHRSVSRNMTIRVLDVNDNAPEFTQMSYSLHLPENTLNGTSVAHLVANDPDSGVNAKLSYELVSDVDEFFLDHKTGVLYVSETLDREKQSEYDLRVRAWDSAPTNAKYSLARVFVTVLDINDCAPEFGAARYLKVTVAEDMPLGTVIATLQATDKDLGSGGRITYSLVSGYGKGSFRIDPKTGVVRISSYLNYETRQIYNITVQARDGGDPPLQNYATLIVQITDVDENASPPSFTKRVVRGWVQENQPPGTMVATLEAADPDGEEIAFTITGGDGYGYFSINKDGK